MGLTTLPLTSNNPFHPLHDIHKHLPCGDISHYQPLFFPTTCHHPDKVLVANLDEGMGTLVHAGSTRNPAFGFWPLRQEVVRAVRRDLLEQEREGEGDKGVEVIGKEEGDERERRERGLAEFLGAGNEDLDWEIVDSPKPAKEKFVLVGKRVVEDVDLVERRNPEWVRAS